MTKRIMTHSEASHAMRLSKRNIHDLAPLAQPLENNVKNHVRARGMSVQAFLRVIVAEKFSRADAPAPIRLRSACL
jgi:predicted DNA binding CopG/RHH family protein